MSQYAGEITVSAFAQTFKFILEYLRAYREGADLFLPRLSHRGLLALKHEAAFYGIGGLADLASAGGIFAGLPSLGPPIIPVENQANLDAADQALALRSSQYSLSSNTHASLLLYS